MTGQERILSLWAFIAKEADGTEGVIGVYDRRGAWVPLVGADLARVNSLRPVARDSAKRTGRTVTLAHFSVRTDQETIEP